MPTIAFGGLAIVAATALAAPLALGLFPRIRLPAIVLEIVLGIVIGPQVLGWVSIDTPIQVMSYSGSPFCFCSQVSKSSTSAFAVACSASPHSGTRSRSESRC
jgi:Sodium/hydrogen exchanger family